MWRLPGTVGAVVSAAGDPTGSSMSSWIWLAVSARSYTRISSIEPSNHSFQIVLPPIRRVPLEAVIAPVVGERVGERAVHVDAKRGAVVRRREVRPLVGGERGGRLHALVVAADEDVAARPVAGRGGVEPVHEVVGLLLEDDRAPAGVRRRRAHPRLERHLVREVERGGVGDGDLVVHAVEAERAAEPSARRPRGAGQRPVVPVAGSVARAGAARLVEAVRGDEAGGGRPRRAGTDRAGDRGLRRAVARGVGCVDLDQMRAAARKARQRRGAADDLADADRRPGRRRSA